MPRLTRTLPAAAAPPGREAFPGDIFYLHSRLLERAARLRPEYGGGSLAALPIVETEAQNLAAYIPTNLISITDGQIYLSPTLARKGIWPAVDIGKSVSRVGGKAQLPAYRAVAGELRLAYAQFEELEAFARFGTRLDDATRCAIDRGQRLREVLKQPPCQPLPAAAQIAVLLAVTQGVFDAVPLERIGEAEQAVRQALATQCVEIGRRIAAGADLSEVDRNTLLGAARAALANPFAFTPTPLPPAARGVNPAAMPTLDNLHRTVATVESLQGIVRTMKTLAAVSIRQYEQAVAAVADYEQAVRLGLTAVLGEAAPVHPQPVPAAPGRREPIVGMVVFGSDHGLCGRFNEDLAEHSRVALAEFPAHDHRILAVGVRLAAVLASVGLIPEQTFYTPAAATGIVQTLRQLLPVLEEWRNTGWNGCCYASSARKPVCARRRRRWRCCRSIRPPSTVRGRGRDVPYPAIMATGKICWPPC